MVTVYQFRVWDTAADRYLTQPLKSPKERIDRIGGEIIDGTAEDVPESALDREGRYQPSDGGVVGGASVGEASVAGGAEVSAATGRAPIGRAPIGRGLFGGGAFAEGAFAEGAFAAESTSATDPALSAGGRLSPQGAGINAEAGHFSLNPVPFEVATPSDPSAQIASGQIKAAQAERLSAARASIRERPADSAAFARELARQFEQQADRLRGKNDRSKDEDEMLDFLRLMAIRLNELSEAIQTAMAEPANEPIFIGKAAKIATELEAGFFEFVTKHRTHIWEVGASGVALYFFGQLGLNPKDAADFLREIFRPK